MIFAFICIAVIALAVVYTLYLVGSVMDAVNSLGEAVSEMAKLVGEQAVRITVLEKEVNKEITFSLSEEKPAKKTTTKKRTTKKDAAA